ncbi:MAG: protein kinase, partial [Ruminococcus sp.]|nr:protein kinase [Ruminococcus sp.]
MGKLFGYIKQPLWDNWYIDKKIGQGIYSEVYRICCGDRVSVLKVKPVFADSPDSLYRKLSVAEIEADIMQSLKDCPYIMGYQDRLIQKISDLQYLLMIRTEFLIPLLEQGSIFPESTVRKIAIDIGMALEYMHSAGVVHCDVKPDNFFISADGTHKIGDFNISGYAGEKRYQSGTCGYTAPEIYCNPVYDCLSDIYSFGKSLYSLFSDISPEFSEII